MLIDSMRSHTELFTRMKSHQSYWSAWARCRIGVLQCQWLTTWEILTL